MDYRSPRISLDSQGGAQHWQRAAFGFSILSGILTGWLLFARLFYSSTIPISDTSLGIHMQPRELNSHLIQELFGYFQQKNGEYSRLSRRIIVDPSTLITSSETSYVTIPSLRPRSYLYYRGHILSFRSDVYGFRIPYQQKRVVLSDNLFQYINIPSTKLAFLSDSIFIESYRSLSNEGISVTGKSPKSVVLSMIQSLNRPLLTQPFVLEDGSSAQEILVSDQQIKIERTGDITSYSRITPYILMTHNDTDTSWSLRTTPATPTDNNVLPSVSTCPIGTLIDFDRSILPTHVNKLVTIVVDKITSTDTHINICTPVDKL